MRAEKPGLAHQTAGTQSFHNQSDRCGAEKPGQTHLPEGTRPSSDKSDGCGAENLAPLTNLEFVILGLEITDEAMAELRTKHPGCLITNR